MNRGKRAGKRAARVRSFASRCLRRSVLGQPGFSWSRRKRAKFKLARSTALLR